MVVKPQALSRLKLLALMAAFIGPLLLATAIYFNPGAWAPPPSSHGEMIEPVIVLEGFRAEVAAAAALDEGFFRGHWTLLLWGAADCGLDCEAGLFKMRQARLALGRNRGRVHTAYLLPPGAPFEIQPPELVHRHPRLVVARLAGGARLLHTLSKLPPGRVYIVDPHGNLMMGYAPDATARGIVGDLKRLLRASRIG